MTSLRILSPTRTAHFSHNVLNNDSFEGSTPTITAVGSPSNGTVTIDGDGTAGTLTYTPTSNFIGSDSFTYTVTSGGVTETASVNVTVNQQNDPGTFTGDTDGSGDEDGGNITGTLNFTDTTNGDSNPNFTVNTGPSNGTATINATTGAWSYSPNADFNGSDSFTVQVTDDDNNTETQVISLTVNGVDDIVADSFLHSTRTAHSPTTSSITTPSRAAHPQLQPLAHHPMAPSPSTATAPLARSHTHQLQTSTALTPSPTPSHPAVSLKQPPSTSPSTNRTTQAPSPVTPTVQVMRTAAISQARSTSLTPQTETPTPTSPSTLAPPTAPQPLMPPRALGPIHPMQTSTVVIHSPFK